MFFPVKKKNKERTNLFSENKLCIQIHFYVNQTKVSHKTCFETEAERNSEMALIAINI